MIASSPLKNKSKTMKKLLVLSAIAFGGLLYNTADAQIRVGVNLGFRAQPVIYNQPAVPATPAYGDDGDDYYYLPDLGVYYNVTDQCYFYFDGSEWVSSAYLPGQYANYDWRNARRFEVRAFRPYMHDDFYRGRYNGNRFENWDRDHYRNNGGYADRDGDRHFDRDRNDQRGQYNRGNDQHYDANRDAYNRPAQQYRNNGQQFEDHGQRFNGREAQNNYNRSNDNKGQGFNNQRNGQNKDQNDRNGQNDHHDRNAGQIKSRF